uniref:Putative secreted protein n=1 Tax=Anopheles darlingi TaxID=43151 RepID=A0A2M4DDK1_ANODA
MKKTNRKEHSSNLAALFFLFYLFQRLHQLVIMPLPYVPYGFLDLRSMLGIFRWIQLPPSVRNPLLEVFRLIKPVEHRDGKSHVQGHFPDF